MFFTCRTENCGLKKLKVNFVAPLVPTFSLPRENQLAVPARVSPQGKIMWCKPKEMITGLIPGNNMWNCRGADCEGGSPE